MRDTEPTPGKPHFPVEVRRISEERLVRLTGDDGHVSEYPFAHLRGWCLCAGWQGHGNEPRYLEAPNSDLIRIGVVGKYALSFAWGGGHDTGIYSYRHLRQAVRLPRVCRPQ